MSIRLTECITCIDIQNIIDLNFVELALSKLQQEAAVVITRMIDLSQNGPARNLCR
jgi:hypothetical protein